MLKGYVMSTVDVKQFLLICTLINYGMITVWFLVFVYAHDGLYKQHSRWFKISPEAFDKIHYAGMAVYKIGVLLLNLVPYIALSVMQ